MKKFDYQPSTSDVETMLTTLTIMTSLLPTLDLEDFDELHKQQNIYYANSAIKRLENLETKISGNELQAIFNSLLIADMINHKELHVDESVAKLCTERIFTIQKLISVFENLFDD